MVVTWKLFNHLNKAKPLKQPTFKKSGNWDESRLALCYELRLKTNERAPLPQTIP